MASRYSAARPKRDGERYARTHHQDGESDAKRAKFDVRNPSILAPEENEEDAVLDADVIRARGTTKRGAVNLDGYDSDSETDNIKMKGETRKPGSAKILDSFDDYDAKSKGTNGKGAKPKIDEDDDENDDIFGLDDDEDEDEAGAAPSTAGRDKKNVRFLDASQIDGQVDNSKTGGHVRLDEEESSDDEVDVDLAIQEEGVDEEVGRGGLKKHAPKVEAFNLKEEMEGGRFDEQGNYVRKADDPDAEHDAWLEGLSKKEMKKAAEAHAQREAEARKQRIQDDGVLVADLLKTLILRLEKAETPLEALARLGKGQTKVKKTPKWKLKKMNKGAEGMDVDEDVKKDPVQARISESINAITAAADKLLSRDFEEIYDQEREMLVREYRRETGEDWVEPETKPRSEGYAADNDDEVKPGGDEMWEFRWTDGRDGGATQGPYDGATMKAWKDAGYFEGGVEFRPTNEDGEWSGVARFA
ncbi:hypothetical protein S7711_06587 [Stachybotrys chartarum IBT 7711]|uniref:GYF domain-containing protein n=1 Tax=Stachybotrys chartarum (strain CBS 109288 / IBT 7711) TaxID=1280523 RepID=A0A084AYP0_STACB|nr:hypothetical protein S7711_06587 [Stachybotrys chartarum IBT 7711]KFA50281.1 hypothetical protein S40293_03370 [Stachybotrys chartarum IBT 40293]